MPASRRQFQIALTALFAALAFVLGRLPHPPNVELVTFTIFTAGFLGGLGVGLVSGALLGLMQIAFGGGGDPFLACAQVCGFATAGAVGSAFGGYVPPFGILAVVGALVTAWYQGLVNLALVPSSGLDLWLVLAAGAPYAAVHVMSNVLVFEAGRFLLMRLERHPLIAAFRKSSLRQAQGARC